MISAGRFFKAIAPSRSKKGLPFTKTCVTSLPLAVIFPSLSTSIPGSCFKRVSTLASGRVLNKEALNSMVSFLTRIGGSSPFTVTSFNVLTDSER